MNWYKTSQIVMDPDTYKGPKEKIWDIGHTSFDIDKEIKFPYKGIKREWLWIFKDGKFMADDANHSLSHSRLYNLKDEEVWAGRAEELEDGTVNVSVFPPSSKQFIHKIPQAILQGIRSQWNEMANVYLVEHP